MRIVYTLIEQRWFRLVSPGIVAVAIWILSSLSALPGPEVVVFDFVFKKMGHMFIFGLLYLTLLRAAGDIQHLSYRTYGLLFLIVVFYAIVDEYHQSLVPNRHASAYDVFFDTTGAFLVHCRVREVI